ncbi:MAG: acyltransferase [Gemmatimonadota bacterium]|nr:acyltransferase [Gemmatimonadota bacterium]
MESNAPMLPKARIPWRHLAVYGWMPSPLKRWAYRTILGYRIGRGVRFSFGGVVLGDTVDLADGVEIGFMTVVQGRTVKIGRYSSIGTQSYISCNVVEIGEDARIREQVFVGGPQLPESRFVLGSRTIILQLTYINPTKPVVIGDDTGIGGHCLIFTHGSWLNVLDGYPVTYEPVTLGKSVWLPWRVFVMPGTTIGDGSVIGASSLVSGTIPPNSLAVGSPAKVIKSAPDFPRTVSAEQRSNLIREMMGEFDRFVTHDAVTIAEQPPFREYAHKGKRRRLLWLRAGMDAEALGAGARAGDTVLTESALPSTLAARYRRDGIFWLDLGGRSRSRGGSPLTEELAAFLGRYGIRLPRDA